MKSELNKVVDNLKKESKRFKLRDGYNLAQFARLLEQEAMVFKLPDNGITIENYWEIVSSRDLLLPYKTCVLEFTYINPPEERWANELTLPDKSMREKMKMIIVAMRAGKIVDDDGSELYNNIDESMNILAQHPGMELADQGVMMITFDYFEAQNKWFFTTPMLGYISEKFKDGGKDIIDVKVMSLGKDLYDMYLNLEEINQDEKLLRAHADDVTHISTRIMLNFLAALECQDVTLKKHEPSQVWNRNLKRKGRTPLFTLHELVLKIANGTTKITKGTYKAQGPGSPKRAHDVRSHYRTLNRGTPNERKIKVREYRTTGEGFLHKEYKLIKQ